MSFGQKKGPRTTFFNLENVPEIRGTSMANTLECSNSVGITYQNNACYADPAPDTGSSLMSTNEEPSWTPERAATYTRLTQAPGSSKPTLPVPQFVGEALTAVIVAT